MERAANPIASESSAIHERQLESSDGKKWIVRTIPTSDFQGVTVMVEQRLFRDGKGGLVYRFDDQSQATKIYHQALCEAKTLSPQEGQPQSPERQCGVGPAQTAKLMSPLRAMLQSRQELGLSVRCRPRRVLSCSKNFTSTGAVAFKSVVAGDMKATLSIDDGRCTTSVTEPYSSPFEGTHTAQVACLISDARTVNTSMEGCIPQRCATGRVPSALCSLPESTFRSVFVGTYAQQLSNPTQSRHLLFPITVDPDDNPDALARGDGHVRC